MEDESKQKWINAAIIAFITLSILGTTLYYFSQCDEGVCPGLAEFVRGFGPWAPLAFAALYIVSSPIPFLAPLLSAVAGLLFGTAMGTLYTIAVAAVSALIPFTLARRDYAPDEVEIAIVDGGSSDGTPGLVPPGVALIESPRGRAVQMNRSAAASRGEILVFCHADSQLPAGWHEAVIEALSQPGVSGGTFQTLILPARGNLMHIRNRMRFPATWWRVYGDQAQFMTRATFERVGGFPEIPLMEDVEMSRALHQEGRLLKINDLRVVTSSRRFLERGFLRQSLFNLWLMFRYLRLGATPEDIARVYRSSREEAS